MLRKLIKYEFKATRRMLLLYGLVIVLAAAMALTFRFGFGENGNLFINTHIAGEARFSGFTAVVIFFITAAYGFVNAFIIAAVFICAITRFRSNLLGNEGYLMHTLPVTVKQHILAKGAVAFVWTILGAASMVLSYLIICLTFVDVGEITEALFRNNEIREFFSRAGFWALIAEGVIWILVAIWELYLRIYASMAVGYSLNRHRMAASVGVFVLFRFIKSSAHGALAAALINTSFFSGGEWRFMLLETAYSVLCGFVFFIIAAWALDKRLNLQ